MTSYVLDTDTFTLYRYGQETANRRVETVPADQIAITIITIEEQLSGWYTAVRKARDGNRHPILDHPRHRILDHRAEG